MNEERNNTSMSHEDDFLFEENICSAEFTGSQCRESGGIDLDDLI